MPPHRFLRTGAPRATILIRVAVGGVFLSEGIQKFLDPAGLGSGRFARIGIPAPELMGPFVGCVEVLGGVLLLVGFATRIAAVPLLISMTVALISTKGPILAGWSFAGFALQKLDRYGFESFLHEARTDLLMLFALAFLLAGGAGPWSVDARLSGRDSGRPRNTGA